MMGEMGRTPRVNAQAGRDHWSMAQAIIFAGGGTRPGQVIGATDAGQFAVPIDAATLALDKEKGIRVRPEHIHLALREFAGIGDHTMAKQFPLVIPEKERLKGLLA